MERLGAKLKEEHKQLKIDVAALRQSIHQERGELESASAEMRAARDLKKSMRQRLKGLKADLLRNLRAAGEDIAIEHLPAAVRGLLARENGAEGDSSSGSDENYDDDDFVAEADTDADAHAAVAAHTSGSKRASSVKQTNTGGMAVDLSYGKIDLAELRKQGFVVTGITPREDLE